MSTEETPLLQPPPSSSTTNSTQSSTGSTQTSKQMLDSIDSYMIPAKISYFINSARYAICDYMILYYVEAGLSPFQASLINGLQHLGGIIAAPGIGFLADRFGNHRCIAICLCFLSIAFLCAQPYFQYEFGSQSSCKSNSNQTSRDQESAIQDEDNLFYTMFISAFLASSVDGSIMSFTEVGVLTRIRISAKEVSLGVQRIPAALGSSLGSLAYSFSIQYFPTSGILSCYVGIFIAYTIFATTLAISFYFLFKGIVFEKKQRNCFKDTCKITNQLLAYLRKLRIIVFLVTVLFNGTVAAIMYSFLFLYLKQELKAPTLLLGTSLLVGNLSAFIVYGFSRRLITFLGGPLNAISVSTYVWALYLLALSYLKSPYYILFIDTLHGFTFCLYKVASLEYVQQDTDSEIFSSVCGIVNALSYSCSFLLANLLGGKLYETFGPRFLFFGLSLICFLWVCIKTLLLTLIRLFNSRKRNI